MEDLYVNYRRYEDGDNAYDDMSQKVFNAGQGAFCPTYQNRTAPCQASCPSGHDIRTWVNIVARRIKPTQGLSWQEFAFQRMVEANPFPAVMGMTCPAPCQTKCNRNDVEGYVGINAIEHTIGAWALANKVALPKPAQESGMTAAVVGSGVAALSCAYQLRRQGHKVVLFSTAERLGGVMVGPGFPQDVVEQEIQRILDFGGIEVRREAAPSGDFAAVFWSEGLGGQAKPGDFVPDKAADDLPTTQVGQGWRAARDMGASMRGEKPIDRPRFDVHRFDLLEDLAVHDKAPAAYPGGPVGNSDTEPFSVHNYEDRSRDRLVATRDLFLAHFKTAPRHERAAPTEPLAEAEAIKESRRCMSCGMCFECSVCIQYCPVGAVERVKSGERSYGRFVETNYAKCIRCQICKDVCPTGYIQMGLER